MMLQEAQRMGLPVDSAPQQYNPQWVTLMLSKANRYKTALEQTGAMSPEAFGQKMQIAQAGKTPTDRSTREMRNAAAMGFPVGSPEYQKSIRAQALKPLVSIGGEETARSKAVGKGIGEYQAETYVDLQKGASAARDQNARLDRLDQLLDQTETGFGAEFLTKARRAEAALGWNVIGGHENIAPAEAAMALSNEMALQLRNPAGGAGMPGSLSDKDREFLVSMVPGLGQTRAGRKLLISARKKMNKRTQDVAAHARNYWDKHGVLDSGFERELAVWSAKNPIFSTEDFTAREAARLPHPKDGPEMRRLDPGTYFVDPEGEIRITP